MKVKKLDSAKILFMQHGIQKLGFAMHSSPKKKDCQLTEVSGIISY